MRCGARHVICVQKNRSVLDAVAIGFTKYFYQQVFRGEKICVAFNRAKNYVGSLKGEYEADLFKLFT